MEGSGAVEGREDAAASQTGQVVGDVGEWEGVLLRDRVQMAIVYCPSDLAGRLLQNRD